ncbi:PH domain-containing protein [Pseudoxanthomonas taiwanensis]|uniref:PH domain-containing protein n=1 Tax=Pseudoxanthomonas taiwanensis TaxID=176598 RepID=UPI001FE6B47B|nr:PH domain-containing protein [Pseudoxanthomonas taiwanensis]
MTEILDAPTPSAVPPPLPPEAEWQPLPRRGALLYALGTAAALALPLALVPGLAAAALLHLPKLAGIALAGGAGLLLGGLVGVVRHRRIGWKLDADGFAIRRGGLWRVETLVPVSRVQHLDLERGPLERRLGLATLVVHTAGTRLAAVRLPLLALEDAEALRAHLARPVESDDAL